MFAVFGLLASVAAISTSAAAQPALNPGMPDLEERYQLTPRWFITLPGKFNRRIEGTVLVFERPGYTMRVSVAAKTAQSRTRVSPRSSGKFPPRHLTLRN